MKIIVKTSFLGLSVLSLFACSTLNDLKSGNIPDLSSIGQNTNSDVLDSRLGALSDVAKGLNVSDEQVIHMALQYSKQSDGENKVLPASSPYSIRLNKLVRKHIKEDSLKLDFKVYGSPEVNAFSLANGSIRVYSGLMDRMNDDELLSVIGHEIGHVKLGHSKSRMRTAYLASGILTGAAGEAKNKIAGNTLGGVLAKDGVDQVKALGEEVVTAQFSQSEEKDADQYGLKFMKKHKYDPKGSVQALRKLAALSEDKSILASLTSSHPDSAERAEDLEKLIGEKVELASEATTTATNTDSSAASTESSASENAVAALNTNAPTSTVPVAQTTWFIQVAAFTDEIIAREMASNLVAAGKSVKVMQALVNGTNYFRVLVGPYADKVSAQSELAPVTSLGFRDGQPFLRNM